MLARLQRLLVLVVLAGMVAWAVYFLARGRPVCALLGAGVMALGYALVLGVEFMLLRVVPSAASVVARPSLKQLLSAWWIEARAAPRVFCWQQPFRSNAYPDHLPQPGSGKRGVVLVHGFVCNRGLWNPWMKVLRQRQVPFMAVNLEPVFGSLAEYPPLIEAAMARMTAHTGLAPVLVAHSMGGLAIRAWLRAFDADARVHHIITIGSPHHGTWLARWGHTANGREMRLQSPWLTALANAEPASRYGLFTCFFGHCDNIVFPAETATLPGADNRHVPGAPHVHLATCQPAFDELLRWLARSCVPDEVFQ